MKYTLSILFAVMAFSVSANDSTKVKASLSIQPVIVNMNGDTAYYLHWKACDVDRHDTSATMDVVVSLLNKKGKLVSGFNLVVPASVVNSWGLDPKPIDDFILSKNPRLKKL